MAATIKKMLAEKTIALQNKVIYWTELSKDINAPEFIIDEIDVVCGQTKLLVTDKFMQMRTLIEEFDNKSGLMPITITDLEGFWNMLLLEVEKLEHQFGQLEILKNNNWTAIEPFAKKVFLKKELKLYKPPEVRSKYLDFIETQKSLIKKTRLNHKKAVKKDCSKAIYCRPTTSNKINFSFTPLLLKTIELSYIARRPSMITKVLVKPQFTLKPAEHENRKQNIKSVKQKNVQFKIPEISCNSNLTCKKSCAQNKTVIPNMKGKPVDTQINKSCFVRRSSRLANKPSRNYFV